MIPVIINNRNLLTWPKAMVDAISNFEMVGEIIILDNGSTYQPLLDWYNQIDIRVVRIENLGHRAPWDSGLVHELNSEYYVVTDPDLDLSKTPIDCITCSIDILKKFPEYGKVGLSMVCDDIPESSPYYNHIQDWEIQRQLNSNILDNHFVNVSVDTTFAVYNIKNYFIGGVSLTDHKAKHIPWYFTIDERQNDDEFMYYINNANSSSSYKTFLNL